jgi:hypothetical protein
MRTPLSDEDAALHVLAIFRSHPQFNVGATWDERDLFARWKGLGFDYSKLNPGLLRAMEKGWIERIGGSDNRFSLTQSGYDMGLTLA